MHCFYVYTVCFHAISSSCYNRNLQLILQLTKKVNKTSMIHNSSYLLYFLLLKLYLSINIPTCLRNLNKILNNFLNGTKLIENIMHVLVNCANLSILLGQRYYSDRLPCMYTFATTAFRRKFPFYNP